MAVRRIVANVTATRIKDAEAFYADLIGLRCIIGRGETATFRAGEFTEARVVVAEAGKEGMPVPDLSIVVDDVEEVFQRALHARSLIEYGPEATPWIVYGKGCLQHKIQQFYLRDPFGYLISISAHAD
jgi:catechol 2,3-dioxygenase-like lactoylglutathione lyase family enzyme